MTILRFWNFTENNEEVELRIDGEIIDDDCAWIYEWFGIPVSSPNAFRTALDEHKGKDITVWIDSWGGDTTAAAGIYNALKEHDGKITVKIDGKAVSAGSVIAMAGDEIKISPLGIMMIHNPWSGVRGEAKDMRHMAEVLDEVKETIVNAYQIKTGRPRSEISKMMDEETWMSPNKALSEGFVDEILYVDPGQEPIENSFMFSRVAIQNSASLALQRFIEQYNQLKPPEPESPVELVAEGEEVAAAGEPDKNHLAVRQETPVEINDVYEGLIKITEEGLQCLGL